MRVPSYSSEILALFLGVRPRSCVLKKQVAETTAWHDDNHLKVKSV